MKIPKIVDYEQIKAEIAREAIWVFFDQGYNNATLGDIAAKCGIGRTTLYSYFKNKEDILFYSLKREYEKFLAEQKSLFEAQDITSLEKMKTFIANVIRDHNKYFMLVIFTEVWLLLKAKNPQFELSFRHRMGEVRLLFKNLIKEAVSIGEIKPVDHEALSSILFGLVEGVLLEKAWNQEMKIEAHLQAIYLLLDGLAV